MSFSKSDDQTNIQPTILTLGINHSEMEKPEDKVVESFSQMMSPIKPNLHQKEPDETTFVEFKTPVKVVDNQILDDENVNRSFIEPFSVLTPRKTNYIDNSAIEMGLFW